MAPKARDGDVVFALSGSWIAWAHTVAAYTGFIGALIFGCCLHFNKIVKNEYYGYPVEWFPSVSATIGDRYPERSIFQFFIAITSGPRFALVFLWYILTARPSATLPKAVAATGVFRTLTCGGWTYVTSTDDHKWHDIFMLSYLFATIPWTAGCIAVSPPNPRAVKYRKILAGLFFGAIVPSGYYFIQHKVYKVPGAYTIYAFFEWSLVLFDVGFDAGTQQRVCQMAPKIDKCTGEFSTKRIENLATIRTNYRKRDMSEERKDKAVAQPFKGPYSWAALIDTVAEVYNGFVFWSILTSLGVVIWYFPLWYMGLSGYEVIVMSTASPLILAIPSVRSIVVRNVSRVHFLSLVGLLAWLVKDPAARLCTVGFAVSMSCMAWSASWWSERARPERLDAKILAWSIGLILSSIAKFANRTNNPIWPILHPENGGWNKTGLVLALLAAWRSSRGAKSYQDVPNLKAPGKAKGSAVLAALGLGGLFFAMHSLLSDSSTMISWVWEGYPIRGPLAVPHGALTILTMSLGVFLGLALPRAFASWTAFGVGAFGAAMLTCYKDWTGYYGALLLAIYLMGVTPVLITSAVQHSPATTFGLGFFVYNLMILFHCWVVAYAFVPGGPLVREHTDWVMATTMLLIGAGVYSALTTNATSSTRKKNAGYSGRDSSSYYLHILTTLQLLSICVAYLRFPTNDYQAYHPEDKVLTAGIWTVHFSLDNDMWTSERRVRDAIKELEIDVIGLLESDLQRIIMGNRDATQYLAEDLGMYADYGPGPNKHTWGSALLSKFPIINSTHHLLPSPVGELAPAIEATLDVYGEKIDVFVFHSGQEEDIEDRRLQSEYLSNRLRLSPRPSILLSYLVTKPHKGNYNTYVGEKSGMSDVDPSDWDRWCQYILYKDVKRTGYARVSRGTITDTEIQVAKFAIGQAPSTDPNERVAEAQVPKGFRFPDLFKGDGVRGHRYHVFDEPRYFA